MIEGRASSYGADVPISMPEPTRGSVRVPMYGFVFTEFGLFHDLSEDDHDRLSRPTFAPPMSPDTPTEYGDQP